MPTSEYTQVNKDDPLDKGVAGYKPKTVELNENKDTVSGRISTLLQEDSPILQQARTHAKQAANKTGTLNTSMTDGAIFGAMMDRATPIASQDAQTSFNTKTFNADTENQGGQFNANQQNTIASQLAGQNFQKEVQASDQDFQRSMQTQEQNWRSAEASIDRTHQLTMQESDAMLRQALQDDMQSFERAQNQLQFEIQNRQIDASQANIILASQQDAINAVLMDNELTAEAKRVAIANIQAGSQSTIEYIDHLNKATGGTSTNTGSGSGTNTGGGSGGGTNTGSVPGENVGPWSGYSMTQGAYQIGSQEIQDILASDKTDAAKVDDGADLIKGRNLPLQFVADQLGVSVDKVQNAYNKRYPNG